MTYLVFSYQAKENYSSYTSTVHFSQDFWGRWIGICSQSVEIPDGGSHMADILLKIYELWYEKNSIIIITNNTLYVKIINQEYFISSILWRLWWNFFHIAIQQFLVIGEGTLPWAISFFLNKKKINIFGLMHIASLIKTDRLNLNFIEKNKILCCFFTKLLFWWPK